MNSKQHTKKDPAMLNRVKGEETLVELVFEEIKDYIVRAKLKSGDRLPSEAELAHQLGCGKYSVREALRSLETLGIIKIVHGKGAMVKEFNFDVIFQNLPYHLQVNKHDLQELFEIREAFEVRFLDKAMETMNSHKISQLEEIVQRMQEAAKEGKSLAQEDFQFHWVLFESLHNTAVVKLMKVFWDFLSKSHYIRQESTEPVATANGHKEIVDALKEGDAVRVKEAMENHFSEFRRRLEEAE